jgi:arylsulfatase A-like enzyme
MKRDRVPNILWICTDQQRYDTVGALGNPAIHTPNLDRLAREGVAFTRAYCQSPVCTPSRASFLTGMYPSTIHACGNGNDRWSGAAPLVSRLLADAGYDCALSGKLHLSAAHGRVERRADDGYRVFQWSHGPQNRWGPGNAYARWLQEEGVDLDELNRNSRDIPPRLHHTTWCVRNAISFIEEHDETPWLMSVNTFDPHMPFDPPGEYMRRYDPGRMSDPHFRESDLEAQAKLAAIDFQTRPRRPEELKARDLKAAYYAMIELIDHNVGLLLECLERAGRRENTLVIFMSDHGEMLGDHGLLLKGCRFYEGLVRVPLIFSWPGRLAEGLVRDALVELIDVAPTVLELARIPQPDRMQGRSLLRLMTPAGAADAHRDRVRCEYYRALNPDQPSVSGLIDKEGWEGSYATMVRDARYKLVCYHGHPLGELFDLERDPHEFVNLWDDPGHGEVRFTLLRQSFDALAFAVDLGPKQVTLY